MHYAMHYALALPACSDYSALRWRKPAGDILSCSRFIARSLFCIKQFK